MVGYVLLYYPERKHYHPVCVCMSNCYSEKHQVPFLFTSSYQQYQVPPWLPCFLSPHRSTNFSCYSPHLPPLICVRCQGSSYGTIKRLGEAWVEGIRRRLILFQRNTAPDDIMCLCCFLLCAAMGFGRAVRLWNIYGRLPGGTELSFYVAWLLLCVGLEQEVGIKSHVVTDWVSFLRLTLALGIVREIVLVLAVILLP